MMNISDRMCVVQYGFLLPLTLEMVRTLIHIHIHGSPQGKRRAPHLATRTGPHKTLISKTPPSPLKAVLLVAITNIIISITSNQKNKFIINDNKYY